MSDEIREIIRDLRQVLDLLQSKISDRTVSGAQVQVVEGLSDITEKLGLITAGEFRSGNGEKPGSGFTGMRMGYPAFVYDGESWHFVGINNDTLQFGVNAEDGKAYAGGGAVVLSEDGITIRGTSQLIRLEDSGRILKGTIYLDASNNIVFNMEGGGDVKANGGDIRINNPATLGGDARVVFQIDGTTEASVYYSRNGEYLVLKVGDNTVRIYNDGSIGFPAVGTKPDYVDGLTKIYYYSDGADQLLQARGKSSATETEVTLANITP